MTNPNEIPFLRVGESTRVTIADREFTITKQSGYSFMQVYGTSRRPLADIYKDLIVNSVEGMTEETAMELDTVYFMPLALQIINIHEKQIADF